MKYYKPFLFVLFVCFLPPFSGSEIFGFDTRNLFQYDLLLTSVDELDENLLLDKLIIDKDSILVSNGEVRALKLLHRQKEQQLNERLSVLELEHELILHNKKHNRFLYLGIFLFLLLLSVISFYCYYMNRKLNNELKLINKLKTRFFNNVSHELRTPLTLIQGPLNELAKPHTEEQHQQYIDLAKHNIERLQFLVNQLLLLSKVDAHQFQLHIAPLELSQHLTAITRTFQLYAQTQGHPYKIQLAPTGIIYGDAEIIEIILSNLISNAFRYSPPKDKISIKGENHDVFYQLEVINKAPQITEEDIAHLFDRFYIVGGECHTSTGIGLSVVHELSALYNISIKVTIDTEQAIHFQIDIPFYDEKMVSTTVTTNISQSIDPKPNQAPSAASPEQIVSLERDISTEQKNNHFDQSTILIVEDDPDMLRYINMCFDGHFNILQAHNGVEGLECAKTNIPDLILSDIMMPRMDGIEFCKKLKNDITTSHIPIILLTALTGDSNEERGLRARADDYITKPFSAEMLLRKVTNILQTISNTHMHFAKDIWVEPLQMTIHGADDLFVKVLEQVMKYDIFDPNFDVEEFCKIGRLSKSQLYRKIKSYVGCTPLDFIKQVRIKQACRLLMESKKPINEIAFQCGFSDASYFSRVFKEWKGISPTEYREQK